MLEGDIRQENKIPGCTKMTRPEEISALSKYLGHVRKVQEEHTKLEKDVLEIPGRTTGRIPKITALEDRLYRLENNSSGEVSRLIHEADLLPENKNKQGVGLKSPFVNSLPNTKDQIPGERVEDPQLGKGKEELPGTRPNLSHLPTVAELLEGYVDRVKGLGKEKESLPDNNNLNTVTDLEKSKEKIFEGGKKELGNLPSSSKSIPSSKNPSFAISDLSQEVEGIEGEKKEIGKLSGWSEKISGEKPSIEELSKDKIDLERSKELESLHENKIDLPGKSPEIKDLPNKWERIASEENIPNLNSLNSTSESLPGQIESPQKLSKDREGVPGEKPELKNLGKEVEKIRGKAPEIEKLSKEKEILRGIEDVNSLSDKKSKLPGRIEEIELGNEREDLPGQMKDVGTLPQTSELLPGNIESPELNREREKLPGERKEPGLEKGLIDLPTSTNPEINSLSRKQEKIEGELNSITELSNTREDIPNGEGEEPDKLSKYSEELPGRKKEVELGDKVEKLSEELKGIDSLPQNSENIPGRPVDLKELPKDSEKILGEVLEITELETNIDLIPGDPTGPEELSTYFDKIEGDPKNEFDKLPNEFQSDQVLPGDPKNNFNELPTQAEILPESNHLNNPENLSEYIDKLDPSPERLDSITTKLSEDGKIIGDPKIPTSLSGYVDELDPKPREISSLPEELHEDGKIIGDPNIPTELSEYVDRLIPEPEDNLELPTDFQENQVLPGDPKRDFSELPTEFQEDQILPGDDYKNEFSELPDELPQDGKLIGDPKNDFDGLPREFQEDQILPGDPKNSFEKLPKEFQEDQILPGDPKNDFKELPTEFQSDQILPGEDYKNDFEKLPDELTRDGYIEGNLKNDFDELPSKLTSDGYVEGDLKNDFDKLPSELTDDGYVEGDLKNNFDKLPDELPEDGKIVGDPKNNFDNLSDYVDPLLPPPDDDLELPTELTSDGFVEGNLKNDFEKLSDYVDELEPKPDEIEELSEYIDQMHPVVSEIESLYDYQEKMLPGVEEIESLSDYQDKLEPKPEEVDKLSDYVEIMEPPKVDVDKLSDYQDKLEPKPEEVDKLSDYLKKLDPTPEEVEELSDYVEIMEPPKVDVDSLSDYIEKMIPGPEEVEALSDYQEKLQPTPDEVEALSDIVLGMYENQHGEPDELSDIVLGMYENQHDEVDKLSDYVEIMEPPKVDVEALSDYVEKMEPGAEDVEALSDYVEKMEPPKTDVEALSDYQEKLDPTPEEVEALSDYLEMMEPGAEDVEALSDYQEKMVPGPEEVDSLSDYQEKMVPGPDEVEALSDIVLQMEENQHGEPEELSDIVLQMEENQHEDPSSLSDYLEMMEPGAEDVEALSDYQEKLNPTPDEVEELSDMVLELYPNQHAEPEELYDSALQMKENEHEDPEELSTHVEKRDGEDPEVELWTENEQLPEGVVEVDELSNHVETRPENNGGDNPESLSDYVDTLDASQLDEFQKLRIDADTIPPNIEAEDRPSYDWVTHNILSGSDLDDFQHNHESFMEKLHEIAKNRSDSEKYDQLLALLKEESGGTINEDVAAKFSTIVSAYLGGDRKIPPRKAEEFEHRLMKEGILLGIYDSEDTDRMIIPNYQGGKWWSLSNGFNIRKIAEEIVGSSIRGSKRALLLNETIAMLALASEQALASAKAEPWRLPGSGYGLASDAAGMLMGGASGSDIANAAGNAVTSLVNGALGGADKSSPMNAPKSEWGSGLVGFDADKKPTKGWNSKISMRPSSTSQSNSSFLGNLLNAAKSLIGMEDEGYTFKGNYMQGKGIGLTLSELCKGDPNSVESVEDLYGFLSLSPFITTPQKFTTTKRGGYNCWTLDSNAYWEIVLEPYLGASNGNFSYLPAFHEINARNKELHGVTTNYSSWIPFVGFDLQKSKLVSKTTGLYDGEIAYPVSMEFTNEFRLTLVDDQYKSWKIFWEQVAEVSVYSSLPHQEDFYKKENEGKYTVIDTQNIIPANYKNITWRCRIFVLTPQMSSVRYYDLLLVMKDMIEEYSGESSDGPAQDLTITFSIVGENPSDAKQNVLGAKNVSKQDVKDWQEKKVLGDGWDIGSMVGDAVSKGLSLIL